MRLNVISKKYLFTALIFGVAALAYWYFIGKSSERGQESYRLISDRLAAQLEVIEADVEAAYKSGTFTTPQSQYPLQIYSNRVLVYWNTNSFIPDYRMIDGDYRIKLEEWDDNKFIIVKRTKEQAGIVKEFVGIVPLYRDYPIENQHLHAGYNKEVFDQLRVFIHSRPVDNSFAFSYGDEVVCYFTIVSPPAVSSRTDRFVIFGLLVVSIVMTFFFFHRTSLKLLDEGKPWGSLLLFFGGIVLLRWLLLYTNFPASVYQFDLFNSRYLVISPLHKSLGDVILTTLAGSYFLFFASSAFFKSRAYSGFYGARDFAKWMVVIVVILASYCLLGYTYYLLQEIFKNSQIHLDVNKSISLDFFRLGALLIFFLLCFSYFIVSHASFLLLKVFKERPGINIWFVHIGVAVLAMLATFLISEELVIIPLLHFAYFSVLLWFNLPGYIRPLRFQAFLYFFLAAAISAILGSYSIYRYDEFQSVVLKQKFANSLLIENDIQGEFQLASLMRSIKSDIFIQSRMMSPLLAKDLVEQRIKRLYLTSYFDKYDVQVILFNLVGMPFNNSYGSSYRALRETYDKDLYRTDYENIFFESNFSPGSTKRYICFVSLERYGVTIGHVVLMLRLKKYLPSSVYPRLLVDERVINEPVGEDYSYGIYDGSNLRYKSGSFNYLTNFPKAWFDNPRLYTGGIEVNGFHHLGIKGLGSKRIVITSPLYKVSWMVSNFSFLFLVLVGGIALTVVFNALEVRFSNEGLNLASKIQIYLSIAFFLPLVIVTLATLSAINNSYKEEIDQQYLKKAESVNGNLVSLMDSYLTNSINKEVLSNEISEIARFSQADINLFSVNGKLITSSQQDIYDEKLLSEYINPEALKKIREEDYERIILSESIGDLNYKSAYLAVKSFNDASLLGIMSLPFFESKTEQQNQQIEVFTNIINIFTFIFILSIVVSFMASRVLTNPLRLIAQRLRRTTFNETNEPIHWKTADEIGLLVNEYNSMLVKLEKSRSALARSEKEAAWKEIAQQVAHEIKNPLTPMKLTLQHMRRLAAENGKEEGLKKPIDNLLQQIDNLSDIVTSFSTFARLPAPDPVRFDLTNLLRNLIQLHQREDVQFLVKLPGEPVFVIADEKMMSGIFTNLIINALQAMEDSKSPRLEIGIEMKEREAVVHVKDYGQGISEEIQDKVFVPSFSTKEAGSGIGLALARRGVEQAGGAIWFETVPGYGTTFYVSLPLG